MRGNRGKLIVVVVAVAAALTAGCSSGPHVSQVAACKHAMRQQLTAATSGNTNPPEPAACKGLPPKTLEKLIGEVFTGR